MDILNEMLQNNTTVEKLMIQHNYLKAEGAKKMVQIMKFRNKMKYLDISANEIQS